MITKYENFLNEGLFSSKYKDIVDKIYNYVLKMSPDEINNIQTRRVDADTDRYQFELSKKYNVDDPFDEENWGDVIIVECVSTLNYFQYNLFVNDDRLDTKNREARKIYKLIEKRKENVENDEKNLRISNTLNKYKDKW